ncbi:MAG: hypothetical protein F4170_05225 [Rhodobacteraceae bacterium]|nr:hypothetical protein [Paracoccaceae bacterium]
MAGIKQVDRVICRTPSPGKKGVTRIPKWKFECIRKAILTSLMENQIPFVELTDTVRKRLSSEELNNMGSLGWHVTTVKLELEVRGEIRRLPQKGKQIIEIVE